MDHAHVVSGAILSLDGMNGALRPCAMFGRQVQDTANESLASFRAGEGRANDSRNAMGHPGLRMGIFNDRHVSG